MGKKNSDDWTKAEWQQRYAELSNRHVKVIGECSLYEREVTKYEAKANEYLQKCNDLEREVKRLQDEIDRYANRFDRMIQTNIEQSSVMQCLISETVKDNDTIEFAGIKTYRGGWLVLNVRGKDLDASGKSTVTIWDSYDSPLEVEVKNS